LEFNNQKYITMCPACLTSLALWIAGTSAPAGIAGFVAFKTIRKKQKKS
jgi:hypothetical protein